MKNSALVSIILIFTFSCYSVPTLQNFDEVLWNAEITNCEDSKVALAQQIVDQKELLLGEGQAEIKSLLGQPQEHELYNRNQKFFYYDLVKGKECDAPYKRLSIRFDALDRVKEVRIIIY